MAAIRDAINTVRLLPLYMTTTPKAYIEHGCYSEPDWCQEVLVLMDPSSEHSEGSRSASPMSFETAIKTLSVLDRTDTVCRRMIGTHEIGAGFPFDQYFTLRSRRMAQRWYRETDRGKAKHVGAIFNAISANPEAFLNMVLDRPKTAKANATKGRRKTMKNLRATLSKRHLRFAKTPKKSQKENDKIKQKLREAYQKGMLIQTHPRGLEFVGHLKSPIAFLNI